MQKGDTLTREGFRDDLMKVINTDLTGNGNIDAQLVQKVENDLRGVFGHYREHWGGQGQTGRPIQGEGGPATPSHR